MRQNRHVDALRLRLPDGSSNARGESGTAHSARRAANDASGLWSVSRPLPRQLGGTMIRERGNATVRVRNGCLSDRGYRLWLSERGSGSRPGG